MKNFKDALSLRQQTVNRMLEELFDQTQSPSKIYESVRYSLLSKSKRIRPILVWESAKCTGGSLEDVRELMCAIEMIHTYSLIHDDLPAMDDDDLRRGVATNHVVFGEAIAILAGDALLNAAFETALAGCMRSINPSAYLQALSVLARASGMQGMIGGQVVDILSEGAKPDAQTLGYIHSHKTGALLRAASTIGAIAVGADQTVVDALGMYGDAVGLMFQIVDDVLDEVGDSAAMGKNIGMDKIKEKMTYPAVYGLDASYKKIHELAVQARGALSGLAEPDAFLLSLVEYLEHRTM